MNHFFPNDWGLMIQNHVWIKKPFKVQDKSMAFNVSGNEKFADMVSDSILQLAF